MRATWMLGCGLAVMVSACNDAPPLAVPPALPKENVTEKEPAREIVVADKSPSSVDPVAESDLPETPPVEEPAGLQFYGISFPYIPASWKRIKPRVRILDAEFELPHAEVDEFDGRLTLMASGGDPDEVIANRAGEFKQETGGPLISKIRIGNVEARWVDFRGEWKGPPFERNDPRPDYRMLLVIIPHTSTSSYYAKLTGPGQTIAAHEGEFRAFLESAVIAPPPAE